MKIIKIIGLVILVIVAAIFGIKLGMYYNDVHFIRQNVEHTLNIDLPSFKILNCYNSGSLTEDEYNYQIKFKDSKHPILDKLNQYEPSTYEVLKYRRLFNPNETLWVQKYDYSTYGSDPDDLQRLVKIMIDSKSDTATIQIINM